MFYLLKHQQIYFVQSIHITMKSRPQSRRIRSDNINSARRNAREQAESYFLKGKESQSNAREQEALEFYIKATICDPSFYQVYCNMGSCFKVLGKYQESKNSYNRALAICQNDLITNYNLANLLRLIGDIDESIKHYKIVIKQQESKEEFGPIYINSLVNCGISYKNQGRYEEAVNIYEKVNKVDPKDESGLFNHAICLMDLIESSPSTLLVNKDRAEKVKYLLEQVEKLNPQNLMVILERIKLEVLLEGDVTSGIRKLKQLQNNNTYIQVFNEIQNMISFCQSFKKVQVLPPTTSTMKELPVVRPVKADFISQKTITSDKTIDLFSSFAGKQSTFLSQEQIVRMLKDGRQNDVQAYINALENDNMHKTSLQLMLLISKAKVNPKFYEKAFNLYQNKFKKDAGAIPFENISNEIHKAIGNLLNHCKMYQEAAQHFDFVSKRVKERSSSMASDHNELAQGFQIAGSMQRALEEYRLAFELEPSSETMSYNLACCLMENGHNVEACKYFNIFLRLLEENEIMSIEQKQLYRTQCNIILALCSHGKEESEQLMQYQKAFKMLKEMRQKEGAKELEQLHLLNFFINFSVLVENKLEQMNSQQQKWDQLSELLLEIFENLLQFENCPDKLQVLQNAGNLSFHLSQYLRAIQFYQQLDSSLLPCFYRVFLCYLHLLEPTMALKYLEEDCKINSAQIQNIFSRQVFNWIFFNDREGEWGSLLPLVKQDLYYQRHLYGLALLDRLDILLEAKENLSFSQVKELTEFVMKEINFLRESKDNLDSLRLCKIKKILKENPPKQSSLKLSKQILDICFRKSNEPQAATNQLINLLFQVCKKSNEQGLVESLLYFFIYTNHSSSTIIQEVISKMACKKKSIISIKLGKIIDGDDSTFSVMPDFDNPKGLVEIFKSWEQVLTPKLQKLIMAIEHVYYSEEVFQALQMEYHFPRHGHFLAQDGTFIKLMKIMKAITNFNENITCSGRNISEMKKDLVSSHLQYISKHMSRNKLNPITLSASLLPLTIHAHHLSRKCSLKFVHSIFQLSETPVSSFDDSNSEQFILIVDRLIKVRCTWGDPMESKSAVEEILFNIADNPLNIVSQSILALDKLRYQLCNFSQEGKVYVNKDQVFKL